MARALSNAKLAAALSDALTIHRRGFSASAAAVVGKGSRVISTEEKAAVKRERSTGTPAATSWVPDPVTGYYRPANRMVEIDAAELRETLLSHNSRA